MTIIDDNDCTFFLSTPVNKPMPLLATTSATGVSCHGGNNGTIDLTVTGGTTPYTYSWNDAATVEDRIGLMAGTYSVTITDDKGCTTTASVTVTEPAQFTASAVQNSAATCSGTADGSATVTSTGGNSPYTYLWDNNASTATVTNLTAGNHTVTVTDDNGCTATATVSISFSDTTAPVPSAATLADITAQCSVSQSDITAPTATDNCSGPVTVTHNASFPITAQGTTVITWTYADGSGNTSTQMQNVIIDDTTAPVPSAATLADITAQCSVSQSDITAPTATDNCSGPVTVTHNASFPITAQGTTVITWTYADGSGNTSTQMQNVIIDDTTAPVPSAATLADITAQCSVSQSDITAPTATDNCSGTVTVTHNASFPITAQGTTVITWTYADGSGNTSTQMQNVIIDDTTAPVPSAATLADITAQCSVSQNDITAPTATDNCSGPVTVTHNASFPITAQGTTVITWTYADGSGNTSTQMQNVIIDDTQNPVVVTQDITLEVDATGHTSIPAGMVQNWATDNCGISNIVLSATDFDCADLGANTVTVTATDHGGNTTTKTFTVTVTDPNHVCPGLSVSETVKADSFTLYPNPARHKVYVKAPANVLVNKITVYSLSGQKVLESSYTSKAETYELKLAPLVTGAYILSIETSGGTFMKKLMVEE